MPTRPLIKWLAAPALLIVIALAAGLAAAVLLAAFGLPYGKSNPEAFAHAYTHPTSGLVMHLHIDAVKDGNTGTPDDWCNPIDEAGAAVVGLPHKVAICLEGYTAPPAKDAPETGADCLNGVDDDTDGVVDDGCSQAAKLESFELSITNDDSLDFAPDPQGIEDQAGEGQADPTLANCADMLDNDGDGKIDSTGGDATTVPPFAPPDEECIGLTAAQSLDDNPDANNTAGPKGLGITAGDDCSGMGTAPPRGSPLPIYIVCYAKMLTTYELGQDPALLATITLDALAPGVDTLSFADPTGVGFTDPVLNGSCFIGGGNIGCFGATIHKVAAPTPTPMPTITPTDTPTPGPVGGIAELAGVASTSAENARTPAEGSGWWADRYAALAGGLSAAVLAVAAGAWYARKRWLR
jgi:hypothetical protein